MAFLIKNPGSGLLQRAGSSFGGMTADKPSPDTYFLAMSEMGVTWVEDRGDARKFQTTAEAREVVVTLPSPPTMTHKAYEIVED